MADKKPNTKLNPKAVAKTFKTIPKVGFTGQMEKSSWFENVFNKWTTQRAISTFDWNKEFFAFYLKASRLYGDISEVLSFGLARREDWVAKTDWINDSYQVEDYIAYAKFNIDNQYSYGLPWVRMQQALMGETQLGNVIGQYRKSVDDAKKKFWRETILDTYKNTYKNIITIEVNKDDTPNEVSEKILNKILFTMKDMTDMSDKYNVIPDPDGAGLKLNATPLSRQHFVWNTQYMVDSQMQTAKIFHGMDVDQVSKTLGSEWVNFGDDSIIGILDTAETIFIGKKHEGVSFQQFSQQRRTMYYFDELCESGVIGFENGVVFKLKVKDVTVLNDTIPENTEIKTNVWTKDNQELTAAAVVDAVIKDYPNLTNKDFNVSLRQLPKDKTAGGTGKAYLTGAGDKFYGSVDITFNWKPEQSN